MIYTYIYLIDNTYIYLTSHTYRMIGHIYTQIYIDDRITHIYNLSYLHTYLHTYLHNR